MGRRADPDLAEPPGEGRPDGAAGRRRRRSGSMHRWACSATASTRASIGRPTGTSWSGAEQGDRSSLDGMPLGDVDVRAAGARCTRRSSTATRTPAGSGCPPTSASGTAPRSCCPTRCRRPVQDRRGHRHGSVARPPIRRRRISTHIPLRYGQTYDFRVRLIDPTGGGPTVDTATRPRGRPRYDGALRPPRRAGAGVARGPADVDNRSSSATTSSASAARCSATRRSCSPTSMPIPMSLLQAASDAAVGKGSFGIPDPDVTRVRIDVEVRALRMDNLIRSPAASRTSCIRRRTGDFPADFAEPCEMPLSFRDVAVLRFGDPADFGDRCDAGAIDGRATCRCPPRGTSASRSAPSPTTTPTTSRRMPTSAGRFRCGCGGSPPTSGSVRGGHAGVDDPCPVAAARSATGVGRHVRQACSSSGPPAASPAIITRLAQRARRRSQRHDAGRPPGHRVVFGCSDGIRHSLAPDQLVADVGGEGRPHQPLDRRAHAASFDRDWTWDNLQPVSFDVFRRSGFTRMLRGRRQRRQAGRRVGSHPTALDAGAADPATAAARRLMFLDAVEPKSELLQPASPITRLPDVIEVDYSCGRHSSTAPAQAMTSRRSVPRRPARHHAAGAGATDCVGRAGTVEVHARARLLVDRGTAQVPVDRVAQSRSAILTTCIFIRFLGYAPDPLLSDDRIETFTPPEESSAPDRSRVDPRDTAGATDDHAGLGAMTSAAGGGQQHAPLPGAACRRA